MPRAIQPLPGGGRMLADPAGRRRHSVGRYRRSWVERAPSQPSTGGALLGLDSGARVGFRPRPGAFGVAHRRNGNGRHRNSSKTPQRAPAPFEHQIGTRIEPDLDGAERVFEIDAAGNAARPAPLVACWKPRRLLAKKDSRGKAPERRRSSCFLLVIPNRPEKWYALQAGWPGGRALRPRRKFAVTRRSIHVPTAAGFVSWPLSSIRTWSMPRSSL